MMGLPADFQLPTEDEVRQAYDTVARMVTVMFAENREAGVRIEPYDDLSGLIEGKRQILRYASSHFAGAYARFTADD